MIPVLKQKEQGDIKKAKWELCEGQGVDGGTQSKDKEDCNSM